MADVKRRLTGELARFRKEHRDPLLDRGTLDKLAEEHDHANSNIKGGRYPTAVCVDVSFHERSGRLLRAVKKRGECCPAAAWTGPAICDQLVSQTERFGVS